MQAPSEQLVDEPQPPSKPPVVRGARACTVCRAAKMKCVGAEDGQKCQRCKRANVDCIFEKHRRGRKPGSKLSEASKMLRRLEKGLSNAKLKSHGTDSGSYPSADPHTVSSESSQYPSMIRPGEYSPSDVYPPSNSGSRNNMDMDADEDAERGDEGIFPAKLIRKENQRNSFFRTILNPEHESPSTLLAQSSRTGMGTQPLTPAPLPNGLHDPISAGLIDEPKAKILFDAIFLRLNPFINLFDPALHSVPYVRSKCPFLFTTLIMAGCKFFEPALYKECLKLAHEMAVRAFAEAWKRVEVVQAFACLTYWREDDDNRTWTYIGYACRMAVELGLNRHITKPPQHETEFQMRERRNRERTYLVLFVHDRSLSMHNGRHWMLPEDDFIRHSATWHNIGGHAARCEDVIVAAMVQLRKIATETTDMVYPNRNLSYNSNAEVNIDIVLKNCNGKLGQWIVVWQGEMQRAGGQSFHFSFLRFFRHYIRLFLNSFGVQTPLANTNCTGSHLRALPTCFASALDVLNIASKEFKALGVLRYGQDSTTIMTAYSAIFLLRLLRGSHTHSELQAELPEGAAQDIHDSITSTAEAYHEASVLSPTSTSAASHARFLRSLLFSDLIGARQEERGPRLKIDQRNHESQAHSGHSSSQPETYHQPSVQHQQYDNPYPYPAPSSTSTHSISPIDESRGYMEARNGQGYYQPLGYTVYGVTHATEHDANYWRNMFTELGFGAGGDQDVTFHDLRAPHNHANQDSHPYHLGQPVYGR